ncbi:MAG: (deoxy)nucleoside triphosphate pyrophosphohydrolase [Alphaproteobacteria bacterium]|nr:(deoxy)nucleoside triphosphate pyrophosphohydrolase [Alphaproteobacteria bacterium]
MTVVAAAIIKRGDEVFIAKRPEGKSLAHHWEFPGGKQENNETLPEALKRELQEELNINVSIGDFFVSSSYQYDFGVIEIYSYFVDVPENMEINSNEHEEVKWVKIRDMENYKFAPADVSIVKALGNKNF